MCKFLTARTAPITAPCWMIPQDCGITNIQGWTRAGPSGRDLRLHKATWIEQPSTNQYVCVLLMKWSLVFTNQEGVLCPCSRSRRRRLGRFANRRRSPKVGGPIRVPLACSLQAHDLWRGPRQRAIRGKAEGMRKGSPLPFLLQSEGNFSVPLGSCLLIGPARGMQSRTCAYLTCAK